MKPTKARFAVLLVVLSILAICAASCQTLGDQSSAIEQETSLNSGSTATSPPPVIKTISAPSNNVTFDPDPTNAPTTAIQNPTVNPTESPQSENLASTSTATTALPTLEPTFTAPAVPTTNPWDHYWFRRPVPEGSSTWTDKAYPYGGTRGGLLRPHHGVEFNVPRGTSILAASPGRVVMAGDDGETVVGPEPNFYGNVVIVEHDFTVGNQPVFSVYGHLSEILVETGQVVNGGDVIALSGASGVADGPHLHFETRVGVNAYQSTRNPLLWLYPFPNRGIVAGLIVAPDGSVASQVSVSLRRLDAESAYNASTSYAEDSINSDDNWGENFVLDDVEAGFYQLVAGSGEMKSSIELWVYPNQTNFVELQLGQ